MQIGNPYWFIPLDRLLDNELISVVASTTDPSTIGRSYNLYDLINLISPNDTMYQLYQWEGNNFDSMIKASYASGHPIMAYISVVQLRPWDVPIVHMVPICGLVNYRNTYKVAVYQSQHTGYLSNNGADRVDGPYLSGTADIYWPDYTQTRSRINGQERGWYYTPRPYNSQAVYEYQHYDTLFAIVEPDRLWGEYNFVRGLLEENGVYPAVNYLDNPHLIHGAINQQVVMGQPATLRGRSPVEHMLGTSALL